MVILEEILNKKYKFLSYLDHIFKGKNVQKGAFIGHKNRLSPDKKSVKKIKIE